MKKFFTFALMAVATLTAQAQDIQLHYDFGKHLYETEEGGRQPVTVTIEQFKADQWGSWYYFVDFDLDKGRNMAAYTEISREFNLGKNSPFAAHVEFDGGLNEESGSFQQAALVGGAWNGHNADFSTTYSVQLMYKQFFKSYGYTRNYASVQLTGVWSTTFAQKKCTFSGFIDFWRGEIADKGKLVILTEPQFWFNATPHLSVGTEVEISNNFVWNPVNDKSFFVNPTLALKWNF